MSYSSVGLVLDLAEFRRYVETLDLSWARAVCLHHTASPSLKDCPHGWKIQHMRNLAHYYGSELGWSAGPHLFTDEDQIYGLSPLSEPGVHARSFNSYSIGIEALGNYDSLDDPHSSRGQAVWDVTTSAVAILLCHMKLGANSETVLFHRDDPATRKTCPGDKIQKNDIVAQINQKLAELRSVADREDGVEVMISSVIKPSLDRIQFETEKIRQVIS